MKQRFVIFYSLASDYDSVSVDAESLREAIAISRAFERKTGAIIVGVVPEYLLKMYRYE